MAENSKIEWTDHTFNPWTGCTKVSPGCDHCYAESWAKRSGTVQWGDAPRRRTTEANWRLPLKWNAQAEREGRRFRVFCASLADVFDNQVPREWRRDLFQLIAQTPNLDWLLLTKRIGNAKAMMDEIAWNPTREQACTRWQPMANVWLGATVVNQEEADRDIPKLLATPARVRFLSMEPLLGPVDLQRPCTARCPNRTCWSNAPHLNERLVRDSESGGFVMECICSRLNGLHWVIVGGESGHGARPMHPDWARSLRDQCAAAGVPFLFKQWGEWGPYGRGRIDGALLADPTALDTPLQRFGKKAAGRLLDGVEHNGFPQVPHA